jgi:hypothetical protein
MSLYVAQVQRLKRATGACVLTVHHLGREGTHLRGSSALDAAQDSELLVKRAGPLRCTVSTTKQKDMATGGDPIELTLVVHEFGLDPDTDRELSSLSVSTVRADPLTAARSAAWIDDLPNAQRLIVSVFIDCVGPSGETKATVKKIVNERLVTAGHKPMAGSTYSEAWKGSSLYQVGLVIKCVWSRRGGVTRG